ncbi:hypothetical protein [Methylibium sp.]|uniref:hypothetical protein n=1 Tax=Methylibium sp. TaxID=2067992 RepID=UPI003D0E0C47
MSSIGPAQFEEEFGGSIERLRGAFAPLRIYKYDHQFATGVRWVGAGRYEELHEGDEVLSPWLEWIDPSLAKELEHLDEALILELGRLEHGAKRFKARLADGEKHLTFEELAWLRESCREWEYRAAANFEARSDGLRECGRVLDMLLAATPFVARDAHLACQQQIGRMHSILNYLYYEAIAVRERVRAQGIEVPMFCARADRVPDVQTSATPASAPPGDVSIVLIAASKREINRLSLRHEAKRIQRAVARARRGVTSGG